MIVIPDEYLTEMPQNCYKCPHRDYPHYCELASESIIGKIIRFVEPEISEADKQVREMPGRPEWCPLIEIKDVKQ